ncbi:MAG TPA: PQQ-binding-like beta-propeller repeat protein [Thermoanaerobaculia bacterium]|nr:PQQ-binding-like beta-propeller repeat protein [Thermoanaerobaculia bacterium]
MTMAPNEGSRLRRPLRLWPGVVILVLQWLARYVGPLLAPDLAPLAMLATLLGGALLVLWWLFLSRAPWVERLGALVLMVGSVALAHSLADPSIAPPGAMGTFIILGFTVPLLSLVLVLWAAISSRLTTGQRWAALVAGVVVASGVWTLVRTGGVTGTLEHELAWRWSATPEERLLAQQAGQPPKPVPPAAPPVVATEQPTTGAPPVTSQAETAKTAEASPAAEPVSPAAPLPPQPVAPAAATEPASPVATAALPAAPAKASPGAAWPGFRGPRRDGIVHGVRIATDWAVSPPVELWRRPVGPGWSSFALDGDLFYTQEQRGEEEVVACYRVSDGEPVWRHADTARFWEPAAGAGPRATPTLHAGRVLTLGATGILNVLDARDGSVVWSRNPAEEHGVEVPGWGFAGSPLVVGDVVIAAVSGRLAAYDLATGTPRWTVPSDGGGYSSPHLVTLLGVEQVLLQRGKGVVSVAPADGTVLWRHEWPSVAIVQPAVLPDQGVLLSDQDNGMRRIALSQGSPWTVEERWTSMGIKPYFNDFVVHEGHVYGFDGFLLASVDVANGKRTWKGGRYGNGQLILLADQDLLLVLGEKGELVLVSASPEKFEELTRLPGTVLEGKTWNHPVLVGDVLLVRNDREMAAFRLQREGS